LISTGLRVASCSLLLIQFQITSAGAEKLCLKPEY
jgi:hypothetical protein